MPYLIDGYNLLFAITDKLPVSKARDALIATLAPLCPQDTFIVFDNSHPMPLYPSRHKIHHLEIINAPGGKTADSYIIEHLHHVPRPAIMTVVTADKMVARAAKELGAQVKSPRDFLKHLEKEERWIEKPIQETQSEIARLLKKFQS